MVKAKGLSLRGPEGAVAISGRQLRFRRWLSHDTVEYCEIAPQGHFLALRAQGATSACGLLAMTNRGGHPRFIDGPLITPVQRRERHAAPYKARAVGGHAPPLPIYHKMTARRGYRRAVVVYRSRKNSRVCSALCTMASRRASRLSNFRSGRRKV